MISTQKMENMMGVLLLVGTLFSASLVCIGGVLFLIHHGGESIHSEWLQLAASQISHHQTWSLAFSFSPLGIIELGLLMLVITQILRVFLLCGFYATIRDFWFTLISTFILFVLIYSLFWR
jgi:uncharacterized membrane protein